MKTSTQLSVVLWVIAVAVGVLVGFLSYSHKLGSFVAGFLAVVKKGIALTGIKYGEKKKYKEPDYFIV